MNRYVGKYKSGRISALQLFHKMKIVLISLFAYVVMSLVVPTTLKSGKKISKQKGNPEWKVVIRKNPKVISPKFPPSKVAEFLELFQKNRDRTMWRPRPSNRDVTAGLNKKRLAAQKAFGDS